MPFQRTQWEQEQCNRAAAEGLRSSWLIDEQAVYRLCPVGEYVDEAHYARALTRHDGTPRSNAAQQRATVSALRGQGMGPEQIAAALGWPVAVVSQHLGPLRIWAPGAARLRAIAEERAEVLKRTRPDPELPASMGDPTIPRVGHHGFRELAPLDAGPNPQAPPASWAR